jgi:hypothetical protein
LIWLGLFNEIISSIVIFQYGYSNAVNTNVYCLFESVLITFFFKKIGLFQRQEKWFIVIVTLYVMVWLVESFLNLSFLRINSYFNILYSFVIVLMSISMINRLILEEKKSLLYNSIFLICVGFIIFFTYAVLVEIFWLYGFMLKSEFNVNIYRILTLINLFVNTVIYSLAILWIPRKREYILL